MKFFNKFKAIKAAAQAGWIASRCTRCTINDETETIHPCAVHETKIARLSKISINNW